MLIRILNAYRRVGACRQIVAAISARRCLVVLLLIVSAALAVPDVQSQVFRVPAALALIVGKHNNPAWVLHKQEVQASKLELKAAEKPCGNWAWAAAFVDMAAARGVHLDQEYVVDRLYGGSRCLDSAGDPAQLARTVSHDYVLADGEKFRLEAHFAPGAPTQPDPLIASLRQDRPMVVFWRHRCYLLTGLDYDEYLAPSGNKMFIITSLKLFDPLEEEGRREVTFSREHDRADEIEGLLDLTIYPK